MKALTKLLKSISLSVFIVVACGITLDAGSVNPKGKTERRPMYGGDTLEVITFKDPYGNVVDSANENKIRRLFIQATEAFFSVPNTMNGDSGDVYFMRNINDRPDKEAFYNKMKDYVINGNFTDGDDAWLENMINPDSLRVNFYYYDRVKRFFTVLNRTTWKNELDYRDWKYCRDRIDKPEFKKIFEDMLYYLTVWKSRNFFFDTRYDKMVIMKDRIWVVRYMADRNRLLKTDTCVIKNFWVWR
jgi:hypothetical protein